MVSCVKKVLPNFVNSYFFLDIGIGSGCLIGSLLKRYVFSYGIGFDISFSSISQSLINLNYLGLLGRFNIFISDFFTSFLKKNFFDLVLSNPPYISNNEIFFLKKKIQKYDPVLALNSGFDSLFFYKFLSKEVKFILKSDGFFIIEINFSYFYKVLKIFLSQRWHLVFKKNDFFRQVRVLVFCL